ncbi:MAG: hypothetical protein GTN86_08365 [Xanthomonadales bacterium]|nr:hypothetical protein [Xanthomonadales bacterium]NIT46200.1 hypothetical protein [Stutzerimonas stutzeri]NIN59880.1 hypothetical protein [Xanthomonadales bacterium]NIN75254.1 hypothetical protein [Xanthomonadales bacterium]NIO15123.1 hypothetical protein [Xanthomonadales bacterium]
MPILSSLVRAALFVSDLERSERLYRDVLGLEESYARNALQNAEFAALLGVPAAAAIRYSILKMPGPARGMIGLFEVRDPAPPVLRREPGQCNVGEVALVFYTDDLEHYRQRLEDFGIRYVCRPLVLSVRPGQANLEMTFRDPDGVMINILQKDPLDLDA